MLGALAAGPFAAAADTDRVVAALISPGAESNRFWTSSLSWHMLDPSLEGLVAQDPVTGDYTGDGLAVSWEHSPDFTEWTFKLREGVEFHFGYGEFTAADVIHSYMLHTGKTRSCRESRSFAARRSWRWTTTRSASPTTAPASRSSSCMAAARS